MQIGEAGSQMYTSVLVPLDGSEAAAQVVPRALELARQLEVPLVLLRVVIDGGIEVTREQQALLSQAEAYLNSIRKSLRTRGVIIELVTRTGDPATATLETAASLSRCLIVMATHGKNPRSEAPLGRVAGEIVRRAGAPVVLIRPGTEKTE
jgi:nucleotide-binding universal stress UspA family protein